MLTMRKTSRLFFWIIILALIIHGLILLFLFGAKYMASKKDLVKPPKPPVTIEHIKPPIPYDLPNMMPGQALKSATEEATDPIESPEEIKISSDLKPQETYQVTEPPKDPKPRRKARPKPTFNFAAINEYATANGNSAFKNRGVNREPTKDDMAILMYQERVRKHFTNSVNQYANGTYFYNIHQAELYLILIIGRNGKVLDIKIQNFSNNPAIAKLLEKIIAYAGLFPIIPATIKLESFTLTTNIKINQGKLTSGYGWQ